MEYADRLSQISGELVREWTRQAMEVYPTESLTVFKRNKDRFANPLPHIISKNIELLFEELIQGVSLEKTVPILTEIVKLKAVQDFTPSQALGFIFGLKKIIRECLKKESDVDIQADGLWGVDQEIDKMASMAFDVYVNCREKLFEIRANEIRNQTHMLIRRVNEMDKQKEAR